MLNQVKPLVRALFAALALAQFTAAEDEYYNQFSVCADSSIVVEELMIVCDSPGAYYYGSNKYRGSATCMGGDKARLQFQFEILEDLETSPYISLSVQGYGSVPSVQLHSLEELCSISSLTSVYGSACPQAGVYQVYEKFYFDKKNDSYEYNFKPVPSIGFTSSVDTNYFDLGGANTKSCAGGTFQNWSTNMGNTAARTIRFFLVTFAILFAASMSFVAWRYLKMKNELKIAGPKREAMEEEFLDDEDVRRIAMMSREKDLIDA